MAAGRAAPSYVASNGISIRGSHDGLNEEATEATASAENDIDWESSEGSDEDDAGICQAPTPPRKPPVL